MRFLNIHLKKNNDSKSAVFVLPWIIVKYMNLVKYKKNEKNNYFEGAPFWIVNTILGIFGIHSVKIYKKNLVEIQANKNRENITLKHRYLYKEDLHLIRKSGSFSPQKVFIYFKSAFICHFFQMNDIGMENSKKNQEKVKF